MKVQHQTFHTVTTDKLQVGTPDAARRLGEFLIKEARLSASYVSVRYEIQTDASGALRIALSTSSGQRHDLAPAAERELAAMLEKLEGLMEIMRKHLLCRRALEYVGAELLAEGED